MKPLRLEFSGINSFSEKAEIDFSRLLSGGVFGIFGDTGSGKTTILDAMIFALYGRIDRARSGAGSEIINYNCEKGYVIFDFEIQTDKGRKIYRVEREIRRKNSAQKLELSELDGNSVHCVSEGVKNTNAKIEEIVGIPFDDFLKCIALPQGEFAQFVKASKGERMDLISRLFGLQAYGNLLSNALKIRESEAQSDYDKAEGAYNSLTDYTAEGAKLLDEEFESAKKQVERLEADFIKERAAQEKRKFDFDKSKRLTAFEREREKLLLQKEEMEEKKSALKKIPEADEILQTFTENVKIKEAVQREQCLLEKIAKEKEFIINRTESLIQKRNQEDFETKLTEIKSKVVNKEYYRSDSEKLKRLKAEREELRIRYVKDGEKIETIEKELVHFLAERAKTEQEAEKFSSVTFEKLFGEKIESELLKAEYESSLKYFSEKLRELETDYFEESRLYGKVHEELIGRISHYKTFLTDDHTGQQGSIFTDISKFLEEKEKLVSKLHEIDLNNTKLQNDKTKITEELEEIKVKGLEIKNNIEELENRLKAAVGEDYRGDFDKFFAELERKQKEISQALEQSLKDESELREKNLALEKEESASLARLNQISEKQEELRSKLKEKLEKSAFDSAEEAKLFLKKYPDQQRLKDETDGYEKAVYQCEANILEIKNDSDFNRIEEKDYVESKEKFEELERARENTKSELKVLKSKIESYHLALQKKAVQEKELAEKRKKLETILKLKSLIRGNAFMEFVAGEYLSDISVAATKTLLKLSNGRYFIRYNQGFFVGDNFNGGNLRSVNTLSGGETFLVSLSLALALSAAIYAKSMKPIEFFFLDEGFGTLDEKLVDTVMDSLEKLRSTNLCIGLISHVEELKHRISNKILVTPATETSGSKITINI